MKRPPKPFPAGKDYEWKWSEGRWVYVPKQANPTKKRAVTRSIHKPLYETI